MQSTVTNRKATLHIPTWAVPFSGGPFSAKHLAAFYYQFGTMLQAGVPILRAFETLRKAAPGPMRGLVVRLAERVRSGLTLQDALESDRGRFAPMDLHVLGIGERSGALDTCLLSLSSYYDNRAKARSRMLSASTFPMVLLVAAVFISRFPALFLGELGSKPYTTLHYLRDTAGFLVIAFAVGWLAWRLIRALLNSPLTSMAADQFLCHLPVFGRLRFDYALSQWLSSMRLMLNAGYGIVQAMDHAGQVTASPWITNACGRAQTLVQEGLAVSQALRSTGAFPEELLQFWATGEESGRMDEMLDRLARQYEERWRRSLDVLATWLPRFAYAAVGVFIIFQMISLLGPIIAAYSEALQ